jgi:hypothetical protein
MPLDLHYVSDILARWLGSDSLIREANRVIRLKARVKRQRLSPE